MANLFGFNTPDIDITGYLSSSWIYIFIVAFIGIILIVTVALVLFFRTYNRKIVVFENISGQGYQPVLKTRARGISASSQDEGKDNLSWYRWAGSPQDNVWQ